MANHHQYRIIIEYMENAALEKKDLFPQNVSDACPQQVAQ